MQTVSSPKTRVPRAQKSTAAEVTQRRGPGWFHLPALVYMIIMTQIPFVLALWFSLHSWNLLEPSAGFPFVGLSNYVQEFTADPNFWPIMGHTLALVVGAQVLALIAGTVLALL